MPLVRLRGPLRRLAGDRAEHVIEGASVGELLLELERAHPAASGWILDERKLVRRHINVFVNGELVRQDAEVEADDRIDVIPAISGGRATAGETRAGDAIGGRPAMARGGRA